MNQTVRVNVIMKYVRMCTHDKVVSPIIFEEENHKHQSRWLGVGKALLAGPP